MQAMYPVHQKKYELFSLTHSAPPRTPFKIWYPKSKPIEPLRQDEIKALSQKIGTTSCTHYDKRKFKIADFLSYISEDDKQYNFDPETIFVKFKYHNQLIIPIELPCSIIHKDQLLDTDTFQKDTYQENLMTDDSEFKLDEDETEAFLNLFKKPARNIKLKYLKDKDPLAEEIEIKIRLELKE